MKVINYNLALTQRGEKPSFYIDRPTFDKLGIKPHALMIPGWYHKVLDTNDDKYYSIRLDAYGASYEKVLEVIDYLIFNGYTLSEESAKELQAIRVIVANQKANKEKIRATQEGRAYLCNKYGCLLKSMSECTGCKHKSLDDLCAPQIIKIKGEK